MNLDNFPAHKSVSSSWRRRGLNSGIALLLLAFASGCAHFAGEPAPDAKFEQLADEFVTSHFAFRPLGGVALGWHQYDGKFVLPDQPAIAAELARLKRFQAAFDAIPSQKLTDAHRYDLQVLESAIGNELWSMEVQRSFSHNPMGYASGLDTTIYLKRDFKPLAARFADVTAILRQAPAYFAIARGNLDAVLPKPFVETAIDAAKGTADFIEKDATKESAKVTDPAVRSQFEATSKTAVAEIRAFADWLKTERLPKSDDKYAVGRDGYVAMLKTELVGLSPEQILAAGLRELRAEQQRFLEAARIIDPTKSPAEVFQSIQKDHPTAAGLIPDTRKDLEEIRKFITDQKLVTIPSEVRARVEETPPPFRSTSFASMDTPGPFETKATEAYYYVTPVEPDWTPQQAEEWLTAFSYYDLDVTSIHEAYPGHYVQFLALNASTASRSAKIFSSYPFVEGWAHYTEQMMMEQGFGKPANSATASRAEFVKAAKYRLAQSDEALLRICRLCCAIRLHSQGMTVDQATRFFMENCYYEEKPARSEATRGTYDPGYLYYTLGKLMICKLRHDWEIQEGTQFSLQRFHDEFLRHGAPPIRLLREIMLKDSKLWPELL